MTEVQAIAETILEGFDRHYRLFREISAGAQERFERADWPGGADANRERIQMYDLRVKESVDTLIERFPEAQTNDRLWPQIKLAYMSLLYEHLRPELGLIAVTGLQRFPLPVQQLAGGHGVSGLIGTRSAEHLQEEALDRQGLVSLGSDPPRLDGGDDGRGQEGDHDRCAGQP